MKLSKKILIQTALLSIIFFVFGQFAYIKLFGIFEPQVNGILFQITEGGGKVKTSILFSLVAALIPILALFTWLVAPVISSAKRFASAAIMMVFIIAAIIVRHEEVKTYFESLAKNLVAANNNITITYRIDPVNFVYYMFAGLCIGCVVSYFLFKERRR
jgi:hypothetical protein